MLGFGEPSYVFRDKNVLAQHQEFGSRVVRAIVASCYFRTYYDKCLSETIGPGKLIWTSSPISETLCPLFPKFGPFEL